MKAIFIKRQLSKDEIHEIVDLTGRNRSIKLYSSVSLPDDLKTAVLPYPDLNETSKREINYDILKKTIDFGEKIFDGKSVSEWLTVDRTSTWHYHKFRIYFSIRNLYIEAREINEISKDYDDIIIFSNDLRLEKLIRKHNLKIDFRFMKTKPEKDYLSFLYYMLYLLYCLLQNLFVPLKNTRHIVFNVTLPVMYLDIPSLAPVKGNYVLGYLFKKMDKDFLLINESETPKFTKDKTFKFSRGIPKKSVKAPALISEGLLLKRLFSLSMILKLFKANRRLKKIYNHLYNCANNDIDYYFLDFIKKFHFTTLYFIFKYYAFKSFFKSHKIKTICSTDENSPEIKSVFDAAKSEGTITVGMQHGAIHELHPAYMYSTSDREKGIMSDYTMVWGEYYKSFLAEKGNYKPDSLIVTGHIRSDVIPLIRNAGQKIKGLPGNMPFIIFASQPQRDISLRKRTARDIFNAVKRLDNILLIIKLHPAEKNDGIFYIAIAEEAGLKNYRIMYDEDLYTLIASCEALITCFSTVGTETAYFYKPLIILDHLKQDIQGYKKEGIAFQATNSDELYHCLKGILEGSLTIDKKAYSNFICKYAYKIDGLVSERCVTFIKSLG